MTTTAVAVMVRPTNTAPTGSSPNAVATPKLTPNGTIAPTKATPSERFRASKNSVGWVSTPGVEHEEEDPDLSQERDRLTGLDEAEDSRSHQHPNDELAHDRGQT